MCSTPEKRSLSAANRACRNSRSSTASDCGDAQAPIWSVPRAEREVGVGLSLVDPGSHSLHAHLALKEVPREQQRTLRVGGEVGRLAGGVVGVENESSRVDALQ